MNYIRLLLLIILLSFCSKMFSIEGRYFHKEILSSICSESFLEKNLVDPMNFSPVPCYKNSYWTDSIPEEMRVSYIKEGEKYIDCKWETIDISLFSEYRENGDRLRYQSFIFGKRNRLSALAMAEIMESKGRFIKDILNGLFSICEETWWGVPAHYGPNIPLPENQSLDLFNAETGGMMAWMYYMFKEPIREFSPYLEKRILKEISFRILEEGMKKREWWRDAAMNWNPWICSNWMACVLFIEKDREKQISYLRTILGSLDSFIDKYPDDGGCDEGAHYWDRAAGSLYDCLNLLKKATNGKVDLSNNKKIKLMGDYLCKMNIGNGFYVNFADAGPRMNPHIDWFPSALYIKNKELINLSADVALKKNFFKNPAAVYANNYFYSLNRELLLLDVLSELKKTKGDNVLLYDSWLPRIQVLTARSIPNSTKGLFLAAKGGHNAESHNHNDVGSFIVYADGDPLFIDPGVGTYRKETFNDATRYNIWCMQSGFHNLPQINGVDQKNGKTYCAKDVSATINENSVRFSLELSNAYPDNAKVNSWKRTILFKRNKYIEVTEKYSLKEYIKPTDLVLMSNNEPVIFDDFVLFNLKEGKYILSFNKDEVLPEVEKLELKDKKMFDTWKNVYRLKLRIKSNKLSGLVKYVIRRK